MKKLISIFLFILLLGCESFQNNNVISSKTGYLVLSNENYIFFKCSLIEINNDKVFIRSDKVIQEVNWKSVRKLVIYNDCLQQEYIEELKRIKQHIDKENEKKK